MVELGGKDEPNQEPPRLREAGAGGFGEAEVLISRCWAGSLPAKVRGWTLVWTVEPGSGQVGRNLR
jgi:hypothetical protein